MTATMQTVDIPDNGQDLPMDESPEVEGQPFNPEYPDSTPDAPYGFKPDGTPYKRHHGGRGGKKPGVRRMAASDTLARSAAGTLAKVNQLTAIALTAGNLPITGEAIIEANSQFEEMAYEALLTDPALCKKILGAGTTSGKAALLMAYGMLTLSVIPAAKTEIQMRRATEAEDETEGVN